jgi:hypothetical protein
VFGVSSVEFKLVFCNFGVSNVEFVFCFFICGVSIVEFVIVVALSVYQLSIITASVLVNFPLVTVWY